MGKVKDEQAVSVGVVTDKPNTRSSRSASRPSIRGVNAHFDTIRARCSKAILQGCCFVDVLYMTVSGIGTLPSVKEPLIPDVRVLTL